jgi:hypothetical protein
MRRVGPASRRGGLSEGERSLSPLPLARTTSDPCRNELPDRLLSTPVHRIDGAQSPLGGTTRLVRFQQSVGSIWLQAVRCVAIAVAMAVLVPTLQVGAASNDAASGTRVETTARIASVAGSGGFAKERPIKLLGRHTISRQHPLRVMFIGDSVMFVAELGIGAALDATGEVTVADRSIDGFGLSIDTIWRKSLPALVSEVHPDIIIGTWGWDDSCTADPQIQHQPCALEEPVAYKHELEQAVRLMLTPGNGVSGVIFAQYPLLGPVETDSPAVRQAQDSTRTAGQAAWQNIVRSLPSVFPGRVMYLPAGSSVLLHGRFSSWLPPTTDPHAPRSEWVRVRMVDNVHMCPAGVIRYAAALLADLTPLYHLAPAGSAWQSQPWRDDPRYRDPPESCPDDHPPA